jgi:hypothetical protein
MAKEWAQTADDVLWRLSHAEAEVLERFMRAASGVDAAPQHAAN